MAGIYSRTTRTRPRSISSKHSAHLRCIVCRGSPLVRLLGSRGLPGGDAQSKCASESHFAKLVHGSAGRSDSIRFDSHADGYGPSHGCAAHRRAGRRCGWKRTGALGLDGAAVADFDACKASIFAFIAAACMRSR
jgi:hypothetical protein